MPRTHIKNKKDFMRFYEKPKHENQLKECVFYQDNREDATKVNIQIAQPCNVKRVLDELKLIKD